MKRVLLAVLAAAAFPLGASAQLKDQHSVQAIIAALKAPISPKVLKDARDFDDKLMAAGQLDGGKVYLVTDARSTRANTMTRRLLEAMGQDPGAWVVRVLDTDPPVANAFVTGGKYVYVYTGLIGNATSDDELVFVLSHELGHSLLKHGARRGEDASTTIASVALLAALLSKKNKDDLTDFAKITMASYSRGDEEEADAIAVTIARRAGFDPMRGIDFFSRGKRQQDKDQQNAQQRLTKMRHELQQTQATCTQWTQQFNSSRQYQTRENANKVNAVCRDAEARRLHFNSSVEQYNNAMRQQKLDSFYSTHPQNQNRIAAVAALNDYIHERRDLQSISKFQQSYRVMAALQQVDSMLLKPPVQGAAASTVRNEPAAETPSGTDLEQRLEQLKRARDRGLITDAEHERKRQEILNRY